MELIKDERIITESGNKEFVLTTHRIRYQTSSWGQAHITSIMLEKISSIEVRYYSWIITLFLGILFIIFGLVLSVNEENNEAFGVTPLFLFAGGMLVLIYFLTRRHVIVIAADGGAKINFVTSGMNREFILAIIDSVEIAKAERASLLNHN